MSRARPFMKYPNRRGPRREARELQKRHILLGPRKSGSEWLRLFCLALGGLTTLSGVIFGVRSLITHQPVQAAVNAVLMFLFGMIVMYAGSHDHFVARKLTDHGNKQT